MHFYHYYCCWKKFRLTFLMQRWTMWWMVTDFQYSGLRYIISYSSMMLFHVSDHTFQYKLWTINLFIIRCTVDTFKYLWVDLQFLNSLKVKTCQKPRLGHEYFILSHDSLACFHFTVGSSQFFFVVILKYMLQKWFLKRIK